MEDHRLSGFTVGITADRRWEEQAELLRRRGACVIHGPSIRTLPLGPEMELREVSEQLILDPPDIVIANTGIGMRAWFAAADSWGVGEALTGALDGAALYARGPKASAALHQAGLSVVATAGSEQMEELVQIVIASGVAGKRIAFQRHGGDSPDHVLALRETGAHVIEVPVYRWILPSDLAPAVRLVTAVCERRVHAVTFTSAPALRNFILVAEEAGIGDAVRDAFRDDVIAVAVGPVCAAAGKEVGIDDAVVPDRFRIGPMIRSLTDALPLRGRRSTILTTPIALQGREARVGTEVVTLSEREAELLGVLLAAAPRVVSRTELVSRVWTAGTDAHVVEVTVGRLRKRLGALAEGIVAVPGRGYVVRP